MKIALIGYGKMGKTIEKIAIEQGHEIVLKIDLSNTQDLTIENLQPADVAIEFTTPHTATANIKKCFEANLPVVVGTTGWYHDFETIKTLCLQNNQSLFYATNFSIGVNLFFEINKKMAALMSKQQDYDVQIKEIHHIHKLDAPSGTAITLAESILENYPQKTNWALQTTEHEKNTLTITSERIDEVPGTHIVTYRSAMDKIELKHEAFSREGFAIGAIAAAKFLYSKKGIFTMRDLLGF